ncbi:hypothetical protein DM45_2834 [Burkholderia mallei]|nr:hypothetical protein DM45_2834 [Burkholderia mallei]KOT09512.1 hypothetical protein DM77_2317 [Burkholderia mallei]
MRKRPPRTHGNFANHHIKYPESGFKRQAARHRRPRTESVLCHPPLRRYYTIQ